MLVRLHVVVEVLFAPAVVVASLQALHWAYVVVVQLQLEDAMMTPVAKYLLVVALEPHLFAPIVAPFAVVVVQAEYSADKTVVAAAAEVVEAVEVGNDAVPTEIHPFAAVRADHADLQEEQRSEVGHFPTIVVQTMWDTGDDTVGCCLANHL